MLFPHINQCKNGFIVDPWRLFFIFFIVIFHDTKSLMFIISIHAKLRATLAAFSITDPNLQPVSRVVALGVIEAPKLSDNVKV